MVCVDDDIDSDSDLFIKQKVRLIGMIRIETSGKDIPHHRNKAAMFKNILRFGDMM